MAEIIPLRDYQPIRNMKRAMLETLKFLTAREVLEASAVCRTWLSLCHDEEVWLHLLDEKCPPLPSAESAFRHMQKFAFSIRDSQLLRCNLFSCQWRAVPCSLHSDMTMTAIDSKRLFACGGYSVRCNAVMVDSATGDVEALQPLSPHRPDPGLCYYEGLVYCFAGDSLRRSKACDKFSLRDRSWGKLPDCIESRAHFNPVVHQSCIYLPNGNTPSIEVFDPQRESYALLSVNTKSYFSTVSVVFDNALIVICKKQVFTLNLTTGKEQTVEVDIGSVWNAFDPVLFKEEVALVSQFEVCFLHLKSLKWKRMKVPENCCQPFHSSQSRTG